MTRKWTASRTLWELVRSRNGSRPKNERCSLESEDRHRGRDLRRWANIGEKRPIYASANEWARLTKRSKDFEIKCPISSSWEKVRFYFRRKALPRSFFDPYSTLTEPLIFASRSLSSTCTSLGWTPSSRCFSPSTSERGATWSDAKRSCTSSAVARSSVRACSYWTLISWIGQRSISYFPFPFL